VAGRCLGLRRRLVLAGILNRGVLKERWLRLSVSSGNILYGYRYTTAAISRAEQDSLRVPEASYSRKHHLSNVQHPRNFSI
jgi:hypothetical protein